MRRPAFSFPLPTYRVFLMIERHARLPKAARCEFEVTPIVFMDAHDHRVKAGPGLTRRSVFLNRFQIPSPTQTLAPS
jgi:hypothetical protein